MAGQQHPFPTGFPNAQQNTMRTQFAGGQMVPGLMGPQQGGIVNPQQFGSGVGVGPGVNANPMGMLTPQQVMAQQQQQMQQQLQQQQMQMQQQPQPTLVPSSSQPNSQATTPQTPVVAVPMPVAKPAKENINTASLCRIGQETVQEIISRMLELFQTLKAIHPPVSTTVQGSNPSNEKKNKIQEHLRMLQLLFKRLKLVYEKCNENCQLQGMEYTHIESLIPLKEEWDMKSDEKKTSEAYRLACEESKEIMEQVVLKNRHLKEVIDHLRRLVSEINTMMIMRRS